MRSPRAGRDRPAWQSRARPARASPEVQLLLDELAEHDGHTALNRLKGLTRETLVHLAQTPAERDHEPRGDLRVFGHQGGACQDRAPRPRRSTRSLRPSPSASRPRTAPARRRCRPGRTSPASACDRRDGCGSPARGRCARRSRCRSASRSRKHHLRPASNSRGTANSAIRSRSLPARAWRRPARRRAARRSPLSSSRPSLSTAGISHAVKPAKPGLHPRNRRMLPGDAIFRGMGERNSNADRSAAAALAASPPPRCSQAQLILLLAGC